ncbi:MAG: PEP-CTERM sorting domain-containing protein [Pirellulaceae bacterium]
MYTNPGDYGATGVHVEDFESLTTSPGTITNNPNVAFSGDPLIGTYDVVPAHDATEYGGAGGVGKFSYINQIGSSTLTFVNSQRYFGFWWSAGDANNKLEFYNNGTKITEFTTNYVTDHVAGQTAYFGNPNANFLGQNPNEPYAFLNFFADCENPNVVFDEIRFVNVGAFTGFESDNHTIASTYTKISGETIIGCNSVPEPSTAASLCLLGLTGFLKRRRRPA